MSWIGTAENGFHGCRLALQVLLGEPTALAAARRQLPGISDSARFHQRWELLGWAIEAPEVTATLSKDDFAIAVAFATAYRALPWQPTQFDHIKQLADDDLAPLVPLGKKLLEVVDRHLGE